jgi:cytidylate kinase
MAIITISRQLGSYGNEIAQLVADRLNYDFVNKSKIGEALSLQGLTASVAEKYDEKKPSFWDSFSDQRRKFSHAIRAVLYDFAGNNNTVILGRGGQVLLKDLPGTLHIRIFAPYDIRLKRIAEKEYNDYKKGEQILRRNDRESSGYIRSFFGADWHDENLYDLIINTKEVSVETGAKIILDTVNSEAYQGTFEETQQKLSDLALSQKAEAVLTELAITQDQLSILKVDKGVVTLTGLANSAELKDECEKKVSQIEGVIRIENEIIVNRPVERI